MRAAVIILDDAAGSLEICEVPEPKRGPGQILVPLHAAGLNHADLVQWAGAYANYDNPTASSSLGLMRPAGWRQSVMV
jgi:NADPH:quinone reductase-like Zn-dependent oxidoreductase